MNTIIKFRCWDEEQKIMWPYAVPLLATAYNGGAINVSKDSDGSFNQFVNGKLLQFIGITDKDGKEIYDGDVVIDDFENQSVVMFSVEDVGSCGCCYPEFTGSGFIAKGISLSECKIIGNIFENPGLLEKIKSRKK